MTFWLVAGAMTVACVAILGWALRRRGPAPVDTREPRIAVYRTRLAEIETAVAAGTLDSAGEADARAELEDAAVGELAAAPDATPTVARARTALVVVALAVPLIAWSLYGALGTPRAPTAPDLPALVAELEARLAETPDDLQGLMLLARSRGVLGDQAGAVAAWRDALRVAPDNPTVLANLAEALVLTDDAQLTGEAAWLLDAALAADPDNTKALWYGGLAADARGDTDLAAARWRALLAQDPPDALRAVIERRLRETTPDVVE